jgi:hypothetical protein
MYIYIIFTNILKKKQSYPLEGRTVLMFTTTVFTMKNLKMAVDFCNRLYSFYFIFINQSFSDFQRLAYRYQGYEALPRSS